MQKVAFVADAHLGGSDSKLEAIKTTKLLSFLEYAKTNFKIVCVCGDLFDFWFEYKHAVVNRYFNILFKFAQLVESGVQVHYIAGNHDFWMKDFLTKEVGITIHKEAFKTEINSKRLFVQHGDGIDKNDKGYRLLKKVLQNRMAIRFYRLIHPDIGVPIARFCSNLSRDKSSHKSFHAAGDYQEYAQSVVDQGYDIVVLAHTHQPLVEKLNGGYYLNPGDWITHFTYGIIDGSGVHVRKWED